MKKVLLLTTGGTIAARQGKQGLTPDIKCGDILDMLPELKQHFLIESKDILNLDSSNRMAVHRKNCGGKASGF